MVIFQENIYPCVKDEEDGSEEKVEMTEKDENDEESVSEDEEWNGGLFMFPGNNICSRCKGIILVIIYDLVVKGLSL